MFINYAMNWTPTDALISPVGVVYLLMSGDHEEFACNILHASVADLERQGWMHITTSGCHQMYSAKPRTWDQIMAMSAVMSKYPEAQAAWAELFELGPRYFDCETMKVVYVENNN